jgi:hypothetical protein
VSANLLPFVQFDFAGRLGPEDGRYLVRSADGEAEHVLVVGGISGLAVGMRRGRRRRGRPKPASSWAPELPVTRLTVIRPGGFDGEEDAEGWLREATGDAGAADDLIAEAIVIVNRALHAYRVATQDPDTGGVSAAYALVTRVGYGTGDELADGRWSDAIEVPDAPGPRARAEALRPQERMAAELGRRERAQACETLLLRARSDLDAGRLREAALQLRVGLEALLAELGSGAPATADEPARGPAADQAARQAEDLEVLTGRRRITGEAANEALAGELSRERATEVGGTLAICERVLRRRRILAR